jgi:hypothetical protein
MQQPVSDPALAGSRKLQSRIAFEPGPIPDYCSQIDWTETIAHACIHHDMISTPLCMIHRCRVRIG